MDTVDSSQVLLTLEQIRVLANSALKCQLDYGEMIDAMIKVYELAGGKINENDW